MFWQRRLVQTSDKVQAGKLGGLPAKAEPENSNRSSCVLRMLLNVLVPVPVSACTACRTRIVMRLTFLTQKAVKAQPQ